MPLFRTILLAADLSERSRQAFRVACSLAHEGTRMFVLHVVERMPVVDQSAAFDEPTSTIPDDVGGRAHEEALGERLRELYAPAQPIDVAYHVRYGVAAEELLRMADEVGADLIVMGTHGRTGLQRLLAGSVAEAVLRRARCPVLVLRGSDQPVEAGPPRVILHPTDFSDRSEAALEVARALARDHGSRLVILHVAPPDVIPAAGLVVPMDPQPLLDALAEIRSRAETPDLKAPVETRLERGDPAPEILRVADVLGCDLVVMGSHGRTGLGRLLMGSAAEAVVRGARCPVLAVRASPGQPASEADRPQAH